MDDLRQTLEKLRDELANAGKRLAELAEKGKGELPAAAKKIDDEYQRLQKLLDSAVDKLKQAASEKLRRK
jgi:predicted nuclease with TOPRIM domain